MQLGHVPAAAIAKFRRSLATVVSSEELEQARFGVAVSGGPDSLALLSLFTAALPGRVVAATVDHGLRDESAAEANAVASICAQISVPHHIEKLKWPSQPQSNRQALARDARYSCLGHWAVQSQVQFVATAHHLDDQAETLMMRLHRGSGVGGLAGVRPRRLLTGGEHKVELIRPVLSWRRAELRQVVTACGASIVEDPTNADPHYDRTRARAFLDASPDWPDRSRMSASALYLADADQALKWVASQLFQNRHRWDGEAYEIDVADLPHELIRRVVLEALALMVGTKPDGPTLERAIQAWEAGQAATLVEVVVRPSGKVWRFEWAPPRRR